MTTNSIVRSVQKVWQSQPTMEGAGVHLRRAFGFREMPGLDPFLLMDDFRSENPADYIAGFPWHPHRGMETITYVLEGDVEHADSLGNNGVISAGDIQWMTAGSGIVHQEMPKGDRKGTMFGFQLWSNLPRKNKMMDPRYQEVKAKEIPSVRTPDGATVRVVAGEVSAVKGPVKDIVSDPEYLDVSLPAGKSFVHATKPDHTVFAYVFEGEGRFDPAEPQARQGDGTIVLYGPGNRIEVSTEGKPVRFLLVSGKPLQEPIAWYGPIVMNTQAEIRAAFREYEEGSFVKTGKR
ncbi:MAG: pirin family protein [Planctomycetes bacterium]|nr:pirin family protein [Planctomycetota bacterium]